MGDFSKSERKWDLEYFCRIGVNLRLRQKSDLSKNNFVGFGVGLKIFSQKKAKREFGLRIILSEEEKREDELNLE